MQHMKPFKTGTGASLFFFFVRRKCEHATHEALQNGHRVVIDRTNIDEHQRSHWLRIARECRVPAAATAALLLQVDVQTCKFFLFYLFIYFCIFMLYLCFKWTFRNARIVKGSSLYHRDLYSYYTNLNIITKLISFGQGTSKAALSTTEICIVNKTLHSKEICIVNKTLHSNLHSKYTLQGKVHIHYMLCICYTVDSKYTLSKQLN